MPEIKTHEDCLRALYRLRRFGIKLGLSTIQRVLENLGNPQNSFSSVHVAGTNGKGSIASALAFILQLAGYKVGLYTSPHLVRFNERIRINGRDIENDGITASYNAVKNARTGKRELTFFEYSTAMAFYEFSRQRVDWAVIETGMGGRLDATNVVRPRVSIITTISLEHQAYLGNTLSQIAGEKAGIIKHRVPVVTGARTPRALETIQRVAEEKSAPLYRLGKEFRVRRKDGNRFSYFGMENTWRNLQTGLHGGYQVDNAGLVLAACEILNRDAARIPLESIEQGLAQNRWPGRLEIVSRAPLVILDGAHNGSAAKTLARFLSETLKGKKLTLVAGILDDKPYAAMLGCLLPLCHRAVLTRARIDRALPPETLLQTAKPLCPNIETRPDVCSAVKLALETTPPDEAICIAGSLYVVGEAKEALDKNPDFFDKGGSGKTKPVFRC